MKTSVLILGVLAAIGCKRGPEPPPPPASLHTRVSAVHFDGDEAGECVDMTAVVDLSAGIIDRETVDDRLLARLKKQGLLRIQQPCAAQFPGRPVFARCILPPATTGAVTVTAQTEFLAFDYVFGGDANMKDCLSLNGRWEEMDRGSSEFREAKLRRDLASVQHLAGGSQ